VATVDLSRVRWRKSSRSTDRANCVEVAVAADAVAARDSKNPHAATLVFPTARWSAFLGGVREGRFEA
jgi:hypothetical protein